jgi:anthranilate synthase component 1
VAVVETDQPLHVPRTLIDSHQFVGGDERSPTLPPFTGGWIGYAGFDAVRWSEPQKLGASTPEDDRDLPDMQFGFYPTLAIFDHVRKVIRCVTHVFVADHDGGEAAWEAGSTVVTDLVACLQVGESSVRSGTIAVKTSDPPGEIGNARTTREDFEASVQKCQQYITAGDAFQIVLSQRFDRETYADPFDIYRSLRIVNPSPYMIYLQARGAILIASSPEILCRTVGRTVVNRPLAGTRPRGGTPHEDHAMEVELLGDDKERAEHVMLVDLGRNDLGRVCEASTIELPELLAIERYSHVMHLSSTVTGQLRDGVDCWDALISALPVGTVSGAPKVRAIQIIDELEPLKRGPYGGGIGWVGLNGDMDIAIALRTMVVPTRSQSPWEVHLQAGAGIVLDSDPSREYQETINKVAALGRAIDVAETAFED